MAGLRLSASPASRSLKRASSAAAAGAGATFVGVSTAVFTGWSDAPSGPEPTTNDTTISRISRADKRTRRMQNLLWLTRAPQV